MFTLKALLRPVVIILVILLVSTSLPGTVSAAESDYDPGDVKAMRNIITKHNLDWGTNPDSWPVKTNNGIIWSSFKPKRIERLSLESKGLTGTVEVSALTALNSLSVHTNNLTGLGKLPSSLKNLSCSNNKLTSLGTLPPSLNTLSCSNNNLTSLGTLPSSLEYLYCSSNKIANIGTLPSTLKELEIMGNKLTSLGNLPPGLTMLRCADNILTSVDLNNITGDNFTFEGTGQKVPLTLTGSGENYSVKIKLTNPDPTELKYYSLTYSNGILTSKYTNLSQAYFKVDTGTAKHVRQLTGTFYFTYRETPTGISFSKPSISMAPGKTVRLNPTITPQNANTSLTWTSSNPAVASIANGTVTAKKEGNAVITATTMNGLKSSCTVKVMKNVTGIRTPLKTYYMSYKKSITVPVVLDSGSKTITSKLTAVSNKPSVAKAYVSGTNIKIKTAKKKGTAKITVKSANGRTRILTVKVTSKAVKIKKAKVSGLKSKYKVGKTAQIKAVPSSSKATNLTVSYKSSSKSRAVIDRAGKVTFKKKGKVTITVKIGTKSIKKKVTVY